MGDEVYSGAESGADIYKVDFIWSGSAMNLGELHQLRCDGTNLSADQGTHWLADQYVQFMQDEEQRAGNVRNPVSLTVNQDQCIMLPAGRFLYMDVGRWLKGSQYFGLIAGNLALLCEYNAAEGAAPANWCPIGSPLDTFFAIPGVTIRPGSPMIIPPPFPPDPYHLFLILPDMHVPAVPFEKPIELDEDRWVNMERSDYFQSRTTIPGMTKFLQQVRQLELGQNLTVVQIGDMYELWAGRGENPYFVPTSDEEYFDRLDKNQPLIVMDSDDVDLVATFVWQTHKMHFELFEEFDECAKSDINLIFLYGNHDSYMSSTHVVDAANQMIKRDTIVDRTLPGPGSFRNTIYNPPSTVYPRVKDVTLPGLFLEHGQRSDSYNRDGNPKGVQMTDSGVRTGEWSQIFDQTRRETFVTGAAAYWTVSNKNFGIYVQGHTHSPVLKYVQVSHYREDETWVETGERRYKIVRKKTPVSVP